MEDNTQNSGSKMMPMLVGLVVVLLLAGAGAYYYFTQMKSSDSTMVAEESMVEDTHSGDAMEEDSMMDDGAMMEEADVTFEISGKPFEFSEETLTVTEGQTVKIVFTNEEGLHDWVIDEFGAATDQIQAGETTEVTFVADQAGEFEYYCSVGNHRAQGMVGTLVVEAAE